MQLGRQYKLIGPRAVQIMGDNTFLTRFGNGSHSKDPASGHNGLASIGSQQERARQTVAVLFGDDGAREAQDRAGGASEAMIDVVGPWGAVKRSRR